MLSTLAPGIAGAGQASARTGAPVWVTAQDAFGASPWDQVTPYPSNQPPQGEADARVAVALWQAANVSLVDALVAAGAEAGRVVVCRAPCSMPLEGAFVSLLQKVRMAVMVPTAVYSYTGVGGAPYVPPSV